MTQARWVKELRGDGRAIDGEIYLGLPVAGYYEKTPLGTYAFSSHWSTLNKENHKRLFDEDVVKELVGPVDKQKLIALAWETWRSRSGYKLGPGPAFVEVIDVLLKELGREAK